MGKNWPTFVPRIISRMSENQRHEILEAARLKAITIDDFISITMTSRKTSTERRIEELLHRLEPGDTLIRHGAVPPGPQYRRNHRPGERIGHAGDPAYCIETTPSSERRRA